MPEINNWELSNEGKATNKSIPMQNTESFLGYRQAFSNFEGILVGNPEMKSILTSIKELKIAMGLQGTLLQAEGISSQITAISKSFGMSGFNKNYFATSDLSTALQELRTQQSSFPTFEISDRLQKALGNQKMDDLAKSLKNVTKPYDLPTLNCTKPSFDVNIMTSRKKEKKSNSIVNEISVKTESIIIESKPIVQYKDERINCIEEMINETKISECFNYLENMLIEGNDKCFFNILRNEYIFGKFDFQFYDRLRAFAHKVIKTF